MNNRNYSFVFAAALLAILPTGGVFGNAAAETNASDQEQGAGSLHGAVFIETNSATGNSVVAYSRASDGILTLSGTFATEGLGTGAGLGSQGALALSPDHHWLIAVNAGSNEISLFAVHDTSLKLKDKVSSYGVVPISISVHALGDDGASLVYVLNNGTKTTPGNIAGFRLEDGMLKPIAGSVNPLSGNNVSPAEVSFNAAGNVLIVTEKATSLIDTFAVNSEGKASGPTTTPSHGKTPFGFAVDSRNHVIVSEAAASALSSYSVSKTGSINVVSGSVSDGGAAACWVAISGNGKIAFTTNAHSATISSYSIERSSGAITLLKAVSTHTDAAPTDMSISHHYLFVSASGANEIQSFAMSSDGTLTLVQTVAGIATGAAGLASD